MDGKFSERFEWDALDLRGVAGREGIASSSLLGARLRSPVDGWVEVVGLDASDKERDLGERDGSSWCSRSALWG